MAGSSALLAKVDAILEKSRKFKADPKEPEWHTSLPKGQDMGTPNFEGLRHLNTMPTPRVSQLKTANKNKIFAAMMEHPEFTKSPEPEYNYEQPHKLPNRDFHTNNTISADIAGLAARYSSNIDTTMNLSYKQKVELEELESRRNDLKLKTEILEKRLNAESQKLTEKEVSLTKVRINNSRLVQSANLNQRMSHIFR